MYAGWLESISILARNVLCRPSASTRRGRGSIRAYPPPEPRGRLRRRACRRSVGDECVTDDLTRWMDIRCRSAMSITSASEGTLFWPTAIQVQSPQHSLNRGHDQARIVSGDVMSRVARHYQGTMRRRQNPLAEHAESMAQVDLKVPLEVERNSERHRQVLRRDDHDHWHGRDLAKITSGEIRLQKSVEHLHLRSHRWRCPPDQRCETRPVRFEAGPARSDRLEWRQITGE